MTQGVVCVGCTPSQQSFSTWSTGLAVKYGGYRLLARTRIGIRYFSFLGMQPRSASRRYMQAVMHAYTRTRTCSIDQPQPKQRPEGLARHQHSANQATHQCSSQQQPAASRSGQRKKAVRVASESLSRSASTLRRPWQEPATVTAHRGWIVAGRMPASGGNVASAAVCHERSKQDARYVAGGDSVM